MKDFFKNYCQSHNFVFSEKRNCWERWINKEMLVYFDFNFENCVYINCTIFKGDKKYSVGRRFCDYPEYLMENNSVNTIVINLFSMIISDILKDKESENDLPF